MHAPADIIAERPPAAVGPVIAIDEHTCRLQTGWRTPAEVFEEQLRWIQQAGVATTG